MLRSMRAHAKWVFYILAVSFIAWLAIGQVMSILGPRGNVVLRVNGTEFQYTEFQQRVQAAIEQIRQQTGSASLTRGPRSRHQSDDPEGAARAGVQAPRNQGQ